MKRVSAASSIVTPKPGPVGTSMVLSALRVKRSSVMS